MTSLVEEYRSSFGNDGRLLFMKKCLSIANVLSIGRLGSEKIYCSKLVLFNARGFPPDPVRPGCPLASSIRLLELVLVAQIVHMMLVHRLNDPW